MLRKEPCYPSGKHYFSALLKFQNLFHWSREFLPQFADRYNKQSGNTEKIVVVPSAELQDPLCAELTSGRKIDESSIER